MRFSKKKINLKLKQEIYNNFYRLLASLDEPQQIQKFLTSYMKRSEELALVKRLGIAIMLENETPYQVIKKKLAVSSATIANVQEMMQKKPAGFILALKKIDADRWAEKTSKKRVTLNRLVAKMTPKIPLIIKQ